MSLACTLSQSRRSLPAPCLSCCIQFLRLGITRRLVTAFCDALLIILNTTVPPPPARVYLPLIQRRSQAYLGYTDINKIAQPAPPSLTQPLPRPTSVPFASTTPLPFCQTPLLLPLPPSLSFDFSPDDLTPPPLPRRLLLPRPLMPTHVQDQGRRSSQVSDEGERRDMEGTR